MSLNKQQGTNYPETFYKLLVFDLAFSIDGSYQAAGNEGLGTFLISVRWDSFKTGSTTSSKPLLGVNRQKKADTHEISCFISRSTPEQRSLDFYKHKKM